MLRDRLSRRVEGTLNALGAGSTLLATTVAASLKIDMKQYESWPWLKQLFEQTRNWAWLLLPVLLLTAFLSERLRSRVGASQVWRTVQHLIDEYREEMFGRQDARKGDPKHFHRVTLYKHVNWRACFRRWPGSGWVVPVIRSGFRTKTRIPCFRASLDSPSKAQGIAGQTFVTGQPIPRSGLPDLATQNATDQEFQDYARSTFVSVKWLKGRKKKTNARALLGIPIEVKGKPWGAMVIDSQNPEEIPVKNPHLKILLKCLGQLLETM